MEDGTIRGVDVVKGATPSLNAESLRVIRSMPLWTPGNTNGKPVRVLMQIPFKYFFPPVKKP
jgi:hypothetical protein